MITNSVYINIIKTTVIPENLSNEEKAQKCKPLQDFLGSMIPSNLYRFRNCKERSLDEFDRDILVKRKGG